MSDRLLLRLHSDESLTWLAQDAQGRALSGANTGAPPAETLARARRILVLVPTEQVLLLETPRMSAQRAQFVKALPFALEDQLASPVEDLHFALPERLNEARVPVAIVERQVLRGWLDRLGRDGIRPDALIPEALALPFVAGSTLVIEDKRALLRTALSQAGASDLAELPDWLSMFVDNTVEAAKLDVYDFRAAPALNLPVAVSNYHARQRDALAFLRPSLAPSRCSTCCRASLLRRIVRHRPCACGASPARSPPRWYFCSLYTSAWITGVCRMNPGSWMLPCATRCMRVFRRWTRSTAIRAS